MKKLLCLTTLLMAAGSMGCSMCSHPFDYSYAAFDEAQLHGQRAGSALAPTSSHSVMTVDEPIPPGAIIEEEVIYESAGY